MDQAVAQVEVINSEAMKVRLMEKVPTLSVEKCKQVQIYCTQESKTKMNVQCTASMSVSINYPKNPGSFDPNNEEHDPEGCLIVPETWIAKVTDKDTLDVNPADLSEGI